MGQTTPPPSIDSPRSTLLHTAILTVGLSVLSEPWVIVSTAATAGATAAGAVVGIGLPKLVLAAGFESFSDRRQIGLVLAFIAAAMGASLFVPREHTPTMMQFWLVALWSTTLTLRYLTRD